MRAERGSRRLLQVLKPLRELQAAAEVPAAPAAPAGAPVQEEQSAVKMLPDLRVRELPAPQVPELSE